MTEHPLNVGGILKVGRLASRLKSKHQSGWSVAHAVRLITHIPPSEFGSSSEARGRRERWRADLQDGGVEPQPERRGAHVKLPASTKAATWSALGGVIVGMALMSYGFGYMSPSATEKIAKTQSDAAVIAVLAPACAAKFRELPDYAAKRAALEKASDYQRSDIFPKELVTLPGKTYTDADLASACTEAVLKMKAASN